MISAQRFPGQTVTRLTRADGTTIMLSADEVEVIAATVTPGASASRCADDHLAEHRRLGGLIPYVDFDAPSLS